MCVYLREDYSIVNSHQVQLLPMLLKRKQMFQRIQQLQAPLKHVREYVYIQYIK